MCLSVRAVGNSSVIGYRALVGQHSFMLLFMVLVGVFFSSFVVVGSVICKPSVLHEVVVLVMYERAVEEVCHGEIH